MTVSKLMYAWCHLMRIDLRCDQWLSDNYQSCQATIAQSAIVGLRDCGLWM